MIRTLIVMTAIFLAGCSIETKPDSIVNPKAGPEPTPRVDYPAEPEAPKPTDPVPHDQCQNDRFVRVGNFVDDVQDKVVWFAADVAEFTESFDANAACAPYNTRAATTKEVLALAATVPHPACRLPRAFTVYDWTDLGFFDARPRPIKTLDGCVDLVNGVEYFGECRVPGPDVSRSTMCVR